MTRIVQLSPPSAPPDLAAGTLTFIGNATVLLRYAGFTILTDPTFVHMHEKVSIGYGMHSTRLTNPAMDIGDLPPLDFILLSHFHGDHFDQVAERALDKSTPIVTTPEAAAALRERGFTVTYAVETWQSVVLQKGDLRLRITSMPGRHGPPLSQLVLPAVMGSMLEWNDATGAERFRLYITGDTLVFEDIHEIPRRFPGIDLALLHLGGTRVLGVMVTMDAEQGVQMLRIVKPDVAIPIHFDDYDVFKSPLSDFQQRVRDAGLDAVVRYLDRGETWTFERRGARAGPAAATGTPQVAPPI